MNLIYLFFKDTYAAANGVAVKAVLWIYSVDHRNQRSSGGDCCRSAHGIDRKNADEEKYERKTGIYTWFSD